MFGREKSDLIENLPMVPMRDLVVFPHLMIPFVIGRKSSIKALEQALARGKRIFLSAQHDATHDNPGPEEIHTVGTVCSIVQSLKLPDGNVKVLVEGLERARALEYREEAGALRVVVKLVPAQEEPAAGLESLISKVIGLFEQYVKLSNNLHYDAMLAAVRVEDPGRLADTISSHLVVPVEEKQNLLEIFSAQERLTRIASILEAEVDKLNVDRRIQGRVKKQMERAQKEYYLNEKMKAIQKELGRKDDRTSEVDELRRKIEQARMPKDAEEKAIQELKRLESMPPMSAEATVSRNYLDWLIAVPWQKKTRERKDLAGAERILNEDHYGLEKVKERILEHLAVIRLTGNPRGSIMCLVGPPGVGKTSLGQSIADATGRPFIRVALGGVRRAGDARQLRRRCGQHSRGASGVPPPMPAVLRDGAILLRSRQLRGPASARPAAGRGPLLEAPALRRSAAARFRQNRHRRPHAAADGASAQPGTHPLPRHLLLRRGVSHCDGFERGHDLASRQVRKPAGINRSPLWPSSATEACGW